MTVILSTAGLTVVAFLLMTAMRRGVIRVQPIQAIFGLRRRRRTNRNSNRARAGRPKHKAAAKKAASFHAVSIIVGPSPCKAIENFADRTLLSSDAPVLPLPECDQAACECRYEHLADRRVQDRRGYQSNLALMASVGSNKERRNSGGRRASDRDDFE